MTATAIEPAAAIWLQPEEHGETPHPVLMRLITSSWWWLSLIASGQIIMAIRPRYNTTAFEDEGLYIYMGHRVLDHWFHGSLIIEYPGSYFSGAPAFYPVVAAIADYFDGLNGARDFSLACAIITMVAVYGIGSQLFGKVAGIIGAAAFACNGSVIMLSHFATYDMFMMVFIASAAWLTVYSAKRELLVWVPAVWVLLACAFFAKYAGALYIPVVAMLAAAVGWPKFRWVAVRQAATIALGALVLVYAVLAVDGQSLVHGIVSTTASRQALTYGSTSLMLADVRNWIGPWLVVGALGAVWAIIRRPRDFAVVAVLVLGSIAGIVEQIHIHEQTSFSKHVAFGLIFTAPLIGALLSATVELRWRVLKPIGIVLAAVLLVVVLLPSGSRNSRDQLTFWVEDAQLIAPLQQAAARTPNKHILGESPSPEKYALRKRIRPELWNDTYQLFYKGRRGYDAFRLAVLEDHFGVIYVTRATMYGRFVADMLANGVTKDYTLLSKVPRYRHSTLVGYWLVYGLINPTVDG